MKIKQYSKYKESRDIITVINWTPKIPEKWDTNKLKFLLSDKITDGPHETPEFIDEGIPFLSVDSIQGGKLVFENCRYISKEDQIRFKTKSNPKKHDIFLGKAASIGKIASVDVDFEFNIWSPLALLRPDAKKLYYRFLEYSLKCDYCQDQIDLYATSNTQKNISMDDIPRIQIITPPIEDQPLIASFLDTKSSEIDNLISKDQQLIDLLKEKRNVLIHHVTTKGLNSKTKFKDSGIELIGKMPEAWEVWKLSHISIIYSGGTPDKSNESYWENGEIPWISSGEVNQDHITYPTTYITREAFANSSAKWIPKGALIMALAGQGKTKGMVAYLNIKTTGNQSLAAIVPIRIFSKYLFYWLKMNYLNIRGFAGEGIRDGLSLDDIKEIKVPMPAKPEQIQIAEYLDKETAKIDQTIEKIEKKIELLEEFKKSLIHHVVTGKVDVRGVQA